MSKQVLMVKNIKTKVIHVAVRGTEVQSAWDRVTLCNLSLQLGRAWGWLELGGGSPEVHVSCSKCKKALGDKLHWSRNSAMARAFWQNYGPKRKKRKPPS